MTKDDQYRFYTSLSYVQLIETLEGELGNMNITSSESAELRQAARNLKKNASHFRESGMKVIIAFLLKRCK